MRLIGPVMIILVLGGCDSADCQWDVPDAEMTRRHRNLPLPDLYAAHVKLTSECTPSRPVLAHEVAKFGPRAKNYAIRHLKDGDVGHFLAASSVILSVNSMNYSNCTTAEREALLSAVDKLNTSSRLEEIYEDEVAAVCSSNTGPIPLP